MTRHDLRDALDAGQHLVCYQCGGLGYDGCRHTLIDYCEPSHVSIAPAHLFSPLAPRLPEGRVTMRISSQTGLPIVPQRW